MEPDTPRGASTAQSLLIMAVLAALLLVGWRLPVFFPLRILVVLFHECGHALTALVTGGSVVELGLSYLEGGYCLTAGGWRFVILNGGYLGSLVAGMVILAASRQQRAARALTVVLGLLVLVVTLYWLRPLISFGFLYGSLTALGLVVMGVKAPDWLSWGFLRLVGLFSVFYALVDVRDDILSGQVSGPTDASMLADLTGIPGLVWGVLWILVGAALMWLLRRRLV